MCLGVPGKITAVFESDGMRMGRVDFGGVSKVVCLEYVPEIIVGDYTVVHVGFAITRIDEEAAQETLRILRDLGAVDEEMNATGDAACPVDPFAATGRA